MGVLIRVRSLPTMDLLVADSHILNQDEWNDQVEDCMEDNKSMTSKASVEVQDLLTILSQQNKSAGHAATVHGNNVYLMMKAMAEARSAALAVPAPDDFIDDPALNQSQSESDDMWAWPTNEDIMDDGEDMWSWPTDKKIVAMERIEQRISDVMWDWMGDATSDEEDMLEDEETTAATFLQLSDADVMWDWSHERLEFEPIALTGPSEASKKLWHAYSPWLPRSARSSAPLVGYYVTRGSNEEAM